GLANRALCLEKPQQQNRVAQIAEINRRLNGADETVLGHYQDRQDASLVQVCDQLVDLERQKTFLRHRLQIAVEAVDHDDGGFSLDDAATDEGGEFARGHLCGVDFMQIDFA